LDVFSDLSLLEPNQQGDNRDQWCDGAIQVDSIAGSPGMNDLDQRFVRSDKIM
jgi:hypothetical protein